MSEAMTLQIQIKDNAAQAAAGLGALVSAMERVKSAASGGLKLTGVVNQLNKLSQISVSEQQISNLERMASALEKLKAVGNVKVKMSSGVTKALTMGDIAPQAEDMARDTKGSVEGTGEAAKQAAAGINEYAVALGAAKNAAKSALKPFSSLVSAFGRIAMYRALRSAIKAITDGFKTGIQNVREYSKAIGSEFYRAMDSANNATFKMKNSLGAALAPVLMSLIPILQTVVSWVIAVVNAINQLISLFRGAATWTRATDAAASSMDKVKKSAGGAAKEVKGLLADWDELNIIQQQPGSGGGGGGGYEPIDYESMFEEAAFDTRIKAIFDWLNDHLEQIKTLVLSIGAALLYWKLSKAFESGLLKVVWKFIGLGIAIYGTINAYKALKDQWENGINWENFKSLVESTTAAVIGLGMAFGLKGIGAGLVGFGLASLVTPIKEAAENAGSLGEALGNVWELSEPSFAQLQIAVGELGIGLSLLTGSYIPALIAAFAELALYVGRHWDEIKEAAHKTWLSMQLDAAPIINWFSNLFGGGDMIDVEAVKRELGLLPPLVEEVLQDIQPTMEDLKHNMFLYFSEDPELTRNRSFAKDYYDQNLAPIIEAEAKAAGLLDDKAQDVVDALRFQWANLAEAPEDYNGGLDAWYKSIAREIANAGMSIEDDAEDFIIPVQPIVEANAPEFDFNNAEIMQPFYDELLDLMADYWDKPPLKQESYLPYVLEPKVREIAGYAGITNESSIEEILKTFRRKFNEMLDPESEVDAYGIVNILQDSIDDLQPITLDPIDSSSFEAGLNNTATNTESYVSRIKTALQSLNGLTFGFSGGLFGGTFNVAMAASGGMFTAGDMFIAREAGPELVGRIGNRTTVANNDQIVTGIAGGVAAGQSEQNALLRQQNDLLTRMLNKKFTAEAVPSSAWGRFNRRSEEMYARNAG